MRVALACLSLLSLAAIPLTAAADPVDNFTLTGNGNTFTWSLPATQTYPDLPHLGFIDFLTTITLNGATQTTADVGFYTPISTLGASLFVPGIADTLDGPIFTELGPGPTGFVTVTFDLGIFNLEDFHFGPNPGPPPPPTPYTLVITQQESVTNTPEPPGLTLLATALIAMTAFLRRSGRKALARRS